MLDLMPEFLNDRETSAIKFHEKQFRLDKNRKKKENFRKPFFSSSNRKPKQAVDIQGIVTKLTKPLPKPTRGHGLEIRDKINQLVNSGKTLTEALLIVKQQYPPH
jgi:hypothetical protein